MANTVRSLLFIVTVTASTAVPGQAFEYQWPITELIRADADVIQIGNKTGEVIQTLETAQLPITCNAICPGWVNTDMAKEIDHFPKEDMTQPNNIATICSNILDLPNHSVPFEIALNCQLETTF